MVWPLQEARARVRRARGRANPPHALHNPPVRPRRLAKAAGILKAEGLRIAKVDATVEKELQTRFAVQGAARRAWRASILRAA